MNSFLISKGGLDIAKDDIIGVVVKSSCDYHSSLAFPEELEGGLSVSKIGNSR